MFARLLILCAVRFLLCGYGVAADAKKPAVLSPSDRSFLAELTKDVVQASRVQPGTNVGNSPTNNCGFTLIMPGGRGGYPAFWVRDFAMSLDSGFVTPGEMLNHLRLVARCQNGSTPRSLKNGLVIPPFSIPDHINFDGTAAFYPGTYASGDDQGNGDYGFLPPVDDHFEFVHIAYALFRATGKVTFLAERIDALTLYDRLDKAFAVPVSDPTTGMITTDSSRRAVGFGFCDAIYLTGELLFPSLLRYRAAGELAELSRASRHDDKAQGYHEIQRQIAKNLASTFGDARRIAGWLLAATKVGRQPDVWGTLYALHLGLLEGEAAERALESLTNAVNRKTIVLEGAVRHVPTDMQFSPDSAWEKTANVKIGTYQNGAFWHTPTGWLVEALQRRDLRLAARLVQDYLDHLQAQDFRKGKAEAPWECFGQNHTAQNGVYMTSVTLPFAVLAMPLPQ